MSYIAKIVLTGGPCGGKTTAMSYIKEYFAKHGVDVVFLPESATQVFADKSIIKGSDECRKRVYENQLKNESEAEKNATENTLIICDRGTMDSEAYCSVDCFKEFLAGYNSNPVSERDRYDGVYHLVTAADGAAEFYTNANGHRSETPEEAVALDKRTLAAWVGHNHLRVIGNKGTFEDKMNNLVSEIAFQLGIPQSLEIELKFLIEKPCEEMLKSLPLCCGNEIVQTYLKGAEGETRRVRKRGKDGSYNYYYTAKRMLESGVREEIERTLTESEYIKLLEEADPNCAVIEKTRYCLVYEEKYFEVDIYPFMKDEAIMELEMKSVDEEYTLPPFIKVIRDVTNDGEYTNHALSKRIK